MGAPEAIAGVSISLMCLVIWDLGRRHFRGVDQAEVELLRAELRALHEHADEKLRLLNDVVVQLNNKLAQLSGRVGTPSAARQLHKLGGR